MQSMNQDQIERAAAFLAKAWRGDAHFNALPNGCAPANLDQGYLLQSRFSELIATRQVGWKIAATSSGGQSHIGVGHPLIGRLFADRVYQTPATLLLRGNRMRVAEAEFCFRFGRDLPAGEREYGVDEVMNHVDALFPAIEVPDSRFGEYAAAGAACLVADNACAREFVLGDAVAGQWREIAFEKFPVAVWRNGLSALGGSGADVLGDPRLALTWFTNECVRRGLELKAGHLVTTGVVGRPVAIGPGDTIVADFGVLGAVELTVADAPPDSNA